MYDARTRDRFRAAVGVLTGIAAVASATAAGVVTGMAAHATETDQPSPQQAQDQPTQPVQARTAARSRPRTVIRWKDRPRHTEVHTSTVYRSVPSTVPALGGGTVTSTSTPTYTGSTASSGTGSSGSGSGGSSGGGTSPGGGGSGPPPSSGGTGGGGGGSQTNPPAPPPPPAQPPAPSTPS